MYTYCNQFGNRILHRYIDENGKRRTEIVPFSPVLFVPSNEGGEYKGIRGESLECIQFDSIKDARDFIQKYSDVENFEIHGNTSWWAQFLQSRYPGEIDWDIDKLHIVNIDIETKMSGGFPNPEKAEKEITAITIGFRGKTLTFGSKPYTKTLPKNSKHIYCESEKILLFKFLEVWKDLSPDIVTGWNIDGFDIPYLINRIRNQMGEEYVNKMAPSSPSTIRHPISVREYDGGTEYSIAGITIYDYLRIYKKFTFKERERYSLDYIAYVELGERKLDYSDFQNLDDLYNRDYERYVDYNIHDVRLVDRLDKKLNLMMLVLTLTYMCHIRHDDVFSQVRMWDTLIYNRMIESKVVIPPKKPHEKNEKYEGAVVFEPKIGLHDWVVSFDLNSLYPHLIMQYNISPEMIVDMENIDHPLMFTVNDLVAGSVDTSFLKEYDLSMTANKAFFKRDKQGFLPQMMETLYQQRSSVKKKMLEAESDVEKIKHILNERGVSYE